MALTAECGTVSADDMSKVEALLTGLKRLGYSKRFVTLTLTRHSAGWEIAGSCLRWADDYYAVRYVFENAIHGRRFTREADAIETFRAWNEEGT